MKGNLKMKKQKLLSIFLSIVLLISGSSFGALSARVPTRSLESATDPANPAEPSTDPSNPGDSEEYLLGDVNGDLIVSSADARLVLRAAVKLDQLKSNEFLAADVNQDGIITAADARMILRKAVDLEDFAGNGYIAKSLSELPSIYNDSEAYFDLDVSEPDEDGSLIVTLVAKNCIGLKSVDLVIEYDENALNFDFDEEGADGRQVAATKSNMLLYDCNSEINGILQNSFYFKSLLTDSATFAEDAKKPGRVNINSESFKAFNFVFSVIDKNINKLDFSVQIKSIEGTEATSITKQVDIAIEPSEHIHEWDDGVVTKAATCAEEGEKTYTCTVCGETKTEEIAKTDDHIDINLDGLCDVCGTSVRVSGDFEADGGDTNPGIDTDAVKEKDGSVYAAPNLTAADIIKAAGAGTKILKTDGTALGNKEKVGSGMVLQKADGTKETIIVKGDNTGDGEITASDARFALRTAVSLEKPNDWQKNASLVDSSKTGITAADARLILRAAVNLEKLNLY